MEVDYVAQAVRVAMDCGGVPVQLSWPREEDQTHDFYRLMQVAMLRATVDPQGHVGIKSAGDAIAPRWLARSMPVLPGRLDTPDKTGRRGCSTCPMRLPARRGCMSRPGWAFQWVSGALSAIPTTPFSWRASLMNSRPKPGRIRLNSGWVVQQTNFPDYPLMKLAQAPSARQRWWRARWRRAVPESRS